MTRILLLLAFAAQDLEKARADLKKAVAESNAEAVQDAIRRLTPTDGKRSVDILLEGYAECAKELKKHWDEKLQAIQDMQSAPKYDKALDLRGQAIEQKIIKVEGLKRHLVQALGTFKSDAAVKELVVELATRTIGAGDWTRRAAVADALGSIDHPDALKTLVETALKDVEPQVRVAAMDSLRARKAKTNEVVDALIQLLQHESWQVRSTAVAALQALAAKEAIDPLIEALAKNMGRLRYEINLALIAFTGVDKKGDPAAWKAWWDGAKEEFRAGTYKPRKEEMAGKANEAGTTFYGIPIESRHVVFVLDRSGSMAQPSEWDLPPDVASGVGVPGVDIKREGDRKIDIARWQLKRALAMLPDGMEFNVIFYNHAWTAMSDTMVKLNATTRKQAFAFIDALGPEGRTNIFDPLEKGLSFAPLGAGMEKLPKGAPPVGKTVATGDRAEKGTADTVFLLSDGLPNTGQVPDPDGIISRIKDLNRTRKVKINTVGVFSSRDRDAEGGLRLLQQLAQDSGGAFTAPGRNPAKKMP
jgi:hypothetical protein